MNIYDENKVITHEEARNTMMKIESNDAYYGELQEELKSMATYITQQEVKEERAKKVEELLELYRAKDNVIEKYTKNSFAYFSELERLSYEIKALEKELEKMK